ncbi:MAG: hypothetical protein HY554_14390 [Elusimicrobia bacterium]|nr:hypothetical protein [Elusimicrobiota bacterium]
MRQDILAACVLTVAVTARVGWADVDGGLDAARQALERQQSLSSQATPESLRQFGANLQGALDGEVAGGVVDGASGPARKREGTIASMRSTMDARSAQGRAGPPPAPESEIPEGATELGAAAIRGGLISAERYRGMVSDANRWNAENRELERRTAEAHALSYAGPASVLLIPFIAAVGWATMLAAAAAGLPPVAVQVVGVVGLFAGVHVATSLAARLMAPVLHAK